MMTWQAKSLPELYRQSLIKFMSFKGGRYYPKDDEFSTEELAVRFIKLQVYGTPDHLMMLIVPELGPHHFNTSKRQFHTLYLPVCINTMSWPILLWEIQQCQSQLTTSLNF